MLNAMKRRTGAVRTAELQARALRQTRRKHSLETAEDYVEAIAELTDSIGEARAVDTRHGGSGYHTSTVIRTVARLSATATPRASPIAPSS